MNSFGRRSAFWSFLLLTACGGPGRSGESDRIRGERALACDSLLSDVQSVPSATASEADIMQAMELADRSAVDCREAFLAEATTPTERVLATHLARQFRVLARSLELSLSTRFDGNSYLCAIMGDAFETLLADVADIETLLQSSDVSREDRILLESLHGLNLETIDLLVASAGGNCR